MYDLAELRETTDRFWSLVAAGLRRHAVEDVPAALERPAEPMDAWLSEHLLLGQTCAWPLVSRLWERVTIVAVPRYRIPWAEPGRYRSLFVSRRHGGTRSLEAARGGRFAFNQELSLSGFVAPLAEIARRHGGGEFFGSGLRTGAHRASLAAVRQGQADLAAIDCVVWELLVRQAPDELAGLEVVDVSAAYPALPYIARAGLGDETVGALCDAIEAAASQSPEVAGTLLLTGVERVDAGLFAAVRDAGTLAETVAGFAARASASGAP